MLTTCRSWLIGPQIIFLACIYSPKIAVKSFKIFICDFLKADIAAFMSQVHIYKQLKYICHKETAESLPDVFAVCNRWVDDKRRFSSCSYHYIPDLIHNTLLILHQENIQLLTFYHIKTWVAITQSHKSNILLTVIISKIYAGLECVNVNGFAACRRNTRRVGKCAIFYTNHHFNQSVNQFITCHSTEVHATISPSHTEKECLK